MACWYCREQPRPFFSSSSSSSLSRVGLGTQTNQDKRRGRGEASHALSSSFSGSVRTRGVVLLPARPAHHWFVPRLFLFGAPAWSLEGERRPCLHAPSMRPAPRDMLPPNRQRLSPRPAFWNSVVWNCPRCGNREVPGQKSCWAQFSLLTGVPHRPRQRDWLPPLLPPGVRSGVSGGGMAPEDGSALSPGWPWTGRPECPFSPPGPPVALSHRAAEGFLRESQAPWLRGPQLPPRLCTTPGESPRWLCYSRTFPSRGTCPVWFCESTLLGEGSTTVGRQGWQGSQGL